MGSAIKSGQGVCSIEYAEEDAKVRTPARIAGDGKVGGHGTSGICEC